MKKFLISFSFLGFWALVANVLAADTTPSFKLDLTETDWFSASASDTAPTLSNIEPVPNPSEKYEVTNSAFVIDSSLAQPATFQPGTLADSDKIASVRFRLNPEVVPTGKLPKLAAPTNLAFAIYETNSTTTANSTTTNLQAWAGGPDWFELSGASVPKSAFDLIVDFDNRDTSARKVRFSLSVVGSNTTNVLTKASGEKWVTLSTAGTAAPVKISFVGCGTVTWFNGKKYTINGEIVVVGDESDIKVPTEAQTAFGETIKGTSYSTVDEFLAAKVNDAYGKTDCPDVSVAVAYAAGLVKKKADSGKMELQDYKVTAKPQADATSGMPVDFGAEPPPETETGAVVTYQLVGSVNGSASSYNKVGDAVSSKSEIKIPTNAVDANGNSYRFFKVRTVVTLTKQPQPLDVP